MKKTFIIALFVVLSIGAFATVWHVNNNPGFEVDFNYISQALASSSVLPGDTLYVYGSPTSYGNETLNKRLTLIGPGYFLNQNQGLQENTSPVVMGTLTLNTGAEGSLISGMMIDLLYTYVSNTVFQRNCINRMYVYASNCIILQNYFSNPYGMGYCIRADGAANLLVANNFIYYSPGGWCTYLDNASSGIFYNNIMTGDCYLPNSEIYNSIFLCTNGAYSYFQFNGNTVFNYNIFRSSINWDWTTHGIAGNNNLFNVTATLYVETGSQDAYYQLCTGSPAIGVGVDGADCGIFGGINPYKLSGIPAIPTIAEFIAPGTGFTIPVQITARSNN